MSYVKDVNTNQINGVPVEYTKQTASSDSFVIQKGQLNKLRLRPQILNEHVESSREVQSVVTSANIVGQIFKASQDNINGINLAMESAASVQVDDFESYADNAALQAAWVPSNRLNVLNTGIVYEGTQSMALPTDVVGDTWILSGSAQNLTGYTATMYVYFDEDANRQGLDLILGDGSNTKSFSIVNSTKKTWLAVVVNEAAFTEDGGTPVDMAAVTQIGYKNTIDKNDKYIYIDDISHTPPPGSVCLRLFDMGSTLPVSGSSILSAGTQYTKIGDLGITGFQESSLNIDLQGGFRIYYINEFVAGTALEIPGNELLIPGNYYAITINYVDTEVSVYGTNTSYNTNYYTNGYAFTTPDESTAITQIGTYSDLMFAVFSTQDVYIVDVGQVADATPSVSSKTNFYIEDENMKRTDIFLASARGTQNVSMDLGLKPTFMIKGSKLEQEYNDDFSDDVSNISLGFRYLFISPTVNG